MSPVREQSLTEEKVIEDFLTPLVFLNCLEIFFCLGGCRKVWEEYADRSPVCGLPQYEVVTILPTPISLEWNYSSFSWHCSFCASFRKSGVGLQCLQGIIILKVTLTLELFVFCLIFLNLIAQPFANILSICKPMHVFCTITLCCFPCTLFCILWGHSWNSIILNHQVS